MSVISSNDIVVNYRLGNAAELDNLVSKLNAIDKEEKDALETLRQFNNQVKKTGNEGKESFEKVSNSAKKTRGEIDVLGNALKGVGGMIAGAFAIGSVVEFSKQVFNVTAEFQKLSAVLTNTLGSRSAAQGAMASIQKFASQTPFSVQELTASFVKLANQGFTPTTEQMKKLGDLASSTGKSFDQLAEAIIDAQTGEFERLKDFGIRASKAGDQVTFMFKEQKTTVDFTSKSIRDYLVSLGDLQGVSGASAAIAGSLGGQLNNLGDAWNSLLNTIGTNLAPIYQKALGLTSSFLTKLNDLFGGKQVTEAGEQFNKIYEKFNNASIGALENAKKNTTDTINNQKQKIEALKKTYDEESKLSETIREEYRAAGSEYDDVQQQKITTSRTVTAQEISDQEKILAAYELNLAVVNKLLNDKKKVTSETKQLSNAELKALEAQYEQSIKQLERQKELRQLLSETAVIDNPTAKLAAEDKFQSDLLKLKKKYLDKGVGLTELDIEVQAAKKEVANKHLIEGERKMQLDILKVKQDATKRKVDLQKVENDELLKGTKDFEDKLYKEILDAEALKQQAIQQTIDFAQTLVNGLYNIQQQRISNEITLLNRRADEEVRLADGNAQKIVEIEEKRRAKEKELRIKAFRAEQQQTIANIIFSAAPDIVKYTIGLPLTAGNLALTLGIVAAQTALVLAQPVPEFAKGVKNFEGGLAKVGEEGSELIKTPKGVYLSPNKPTLTFLPKGTDVITASKTREILSFAGKQPTNTTNQMIDVSPIAKAVSSIPVQSFELSEKGIRRFVKRGNTTTQILNKTRGANL
jgi:hypothetical protein